MSNGLSDVNSKNSEKVRIKQLKSREQDLLKREQECSEMVKHLAAIKAPSSRWLSGRASASGSGGRGFEPRPRHTKGVKNGTSGYLAWCSAL